MSNSFFSSFKIKLQVTLTFFLISAFLGLSLRMMHAGLIPGNFKYILHTHSHIVLLGWLYNAIFIILQKFIFKRNDKPLNIIFWLSQITFLGMMFSFPFQGYAFASITFSTLYLFCSYALVFYLFQYSKTIENKNVVRLLRWGGIYLILSSLGPFSLGFIMAKGLAETYWFKLSIYWFLHFLYNGFFALVVFAYLLSKLNSYKNQSVISWLMVASVIPLYALSSLWLSPNWLVYIIALVGSLFQLIAFIFLLKQEGFKAAFNQKIVRLLVAISMISYGLKMIFQVVSVFPSIQDFLNKTTAFSVIGFIHLVMLGFFTLFIFVAWIKEGFLSITTSLKIGLSILISGIVLSELLLFGQSLVVYFELKGIPNYFKALTHASSLMPLGIVFLTWKVFKSN